MRRKVENPTGQAKDPVRSAFALFLKELVWRHGIRFSPTKRPICVYGSRRSGSTLLMEVICANRGVMFSDQPFSIYTASSANINLLPLFPYGQVAFPDDEEEQVLLAYVKGLLNGQIMANAPWKMLTGSAHFRNNRICLKITDAKTMIDWMDAQFDLHTVVLTRHPIAQAVSVLNAGWLCTGKGLLRNAGYVERWLNNDLEAYSWEVYRTGSELERRVLDWALENLPMLSQLVENNHWLYVSYEALVTNTEAVVGYLADKLELADRRRMLRRVKKPSRSTARESTPERKLLIRKQNRKDLVNSWRAHVTDDDRKACFHVLQQFGIDLYQADCALPIYDRVGRKPFV